MKPVAYRPLLPGRSGGPAVGPRAGRVEYPVGGGTTSYHHPLTYPLLDGRMYVRQRDGVYCWDLRKDQ